MAAIELIIDWESIATSLPDKHSHGMSIITKVFHQLDHIFMNVGMSHDSFVPKVKLVLFDI